MSGLLIRSETAKDFTAVYALNASAFPTDDEAKLVDSLRQQASPIISLVAEINEQVIGHIMLSPVTIEQSNSNTKVMGLAPMAVQPSCQRSGIGSALIHTAIAECKLQKIDAVVVLGHIDYYPKFGFKPADTFDLNCEYEVPREAFMALELVPNSLNNCSGLVKYHPCFAEL